MHNPHKASGKAAKVGGDHEFFAVFHSHHVRREEDLAGKVNGLFGKGVHNHVAVGTGQGLEAVHVGVDACEEVLLPGHCHGQVGIQNELIEHREIAVHAELQVLHLVAQNAGTGGFGACAGQGGTTDLVGGGIFHQFPALIVLGPAGIGEKVAYALAGIHRGTAAKGKQDAGGCSCKLLLHLPGVGINAVRCGFLACIHKDHHIAFSNREAFGQIVVGKEVVKEPHCRAALDTQGSKHFLKLGNGALAYHDMTDILGIPVRWRCHNFSV